MTPEPRPTPVQSRFTLDAVLSLYEDHPLQADAILRRVRRRRNEAAAAGPPADPADPDAPVTPLELAVDDRTELTDQNHVGGVTFVEALATAAGVRAADVVYDLGCGLGGPARYLALTRRCRVVGIDASPTRCAQARDLNRLVGLDGRVTIECADVEQCPVPRATADVLWGQCSWIHVWDRARFFRRWVPALRPGGRIAFEEPYLRRLPSSAEHTALVARVAGTWRARLSDAAAWHDDLAAAGATTVTHQRDLFEAFEDFLVRLLPPAGTAANHYFPADEVAGWRAALQLVRAGVVGYLRLVARI